MRGREGKGGKKEAIKRCIKWKEEEEVGGKKAEGRR